MLAFTVGTIALVAICFRWISAHLTEWSGFMKFTLKTLCLLVFIMLYLITLLQPKVEPPQQFASKVVFLYFIITTVFGFYTVGRDYYRYFRRKKDQAGA